MARRPSLFGPTPAAIQQAQADERLERAALLSQLPLGFGGAISGQLFGQAIGSALGAVDPRLREAEASQEVQRRIQARGLTPGTREFTDAVTQEFRSLGMEDQAIRANILGRQLESEELGVERQRRELAPADPRNRQSRAEALIAAGIDPGVASAALDDPKLFRGLIQESQKDPRTTLEKNFERAIADPQFKRFMVEMRRAGASKNVINIDRPLSLSDASKVRFRNGPPIRPGITGRQAQEAVLSGEAEVLTPEKLKRLTLEEQREVTRLDAEGAIADFESLVQEFGGFDALNPAQRARLEEAAQRTGKAVAQHRNPPGTEASQAAADSIARRLNRPVLAAGGGLGGIISDLRSQVGGAGGALSADEQAELEALRRSQ